MFIDELRNFCISKKGVTEEFPFNKNILVFKVMGKMFLAVSLEKWENGNSDINTKCDPERAIELRKTYEGITSGWHMNKKHWNTIRLNSSDVSDQLATKLINHSYELVLKGLTKKLQKELEEL